MIYCKICGNVNCKKHSFLLGKIKNIKDFSGSSPPEIFVRKYNYPNVNIGILSPPSYGETHILSSVEEWHKQKLKIPQILTLRNQLIYGRTKGHIKKTNEKFTEVMQEVAMAYKPVSTEFKLKKPVSSNKEKDDRTPIISNAAPIKKIRLQENPKIKPKVEYLTSDTDAKSITGILELKIRIKIK